LNNYIHPNENRANFITLIRNVGDEHKITFTESEIDNAIDSNLPMLDRTSAQRIRAAEFIALSILLKYGIRPRHLDRVHRVEHQPYTSPTVIPAARFQMKLLSQRLNRRGHGGGPS
jgi:hypothetical protein